MTVDPLSLLVHFVVSGTVVALASCPCDWNLPKLKPLGDVQFGYLVVLVCRRSSSLGSNTCGRIVIVSLVLIFLSISRYFAVSLFLLL